MDLLRLRCCLVECHTTVWYFFFVHVSVCSHVPLFDDGGLSCLNAACAWLGCVYCCSQYVCTQVAVPPHSKSWTSQRLRRWSRSFTQRRGASVGGNTRYWQSCAFLMLRKCVFCFVEGLALFELECCSQGDLHHQIMKQCWKCRGFVQQPHKWPEFQHAKLFMNVLSGLNHLHHIGVVHRYMKPPNILFTGRRHGCDY